MLDIWADPLHWGKQAWEEPRKMTHVIRHTLLLTLESACQEKSWRRNVLGHLPVAPGAGNATVHWCGVGRNRHVQSIFFLLCRDTFIVTLGNAITSILAGFAIFSVLGYMSQELGVPVNQVAKAGEVKRRPYLLHPLPGCTEEHPFQDGKHLRLSV